MIASQTAEKLLDSLTDAQRAAVGHLDGPLLVLAGPGSGKTTVVTRRIANLIASGIPAWQILALTFTNKAAGEMRERIDALVPDDVPGRRGLTVATFHSFCVRLLRHYAQFAGVNERFTIYDTSDQREAIKQALKEAGLSSSNWTPASVGAAISNAKNQLMDAAAYSAQASDFYTRSIAKAYASYERQLKDNDALDFDDLLLLTAILLREHETVRDELQRRFQYILIDEYQDTNHAQFVIAHSLAASHTNICVVGDPDQSIYGWRGADIRNILEFEQHYPNATIIPLGQNFRSTSHIVTVADQLIRRNTRRKHKDLHTKLGEGEKPRVIICQDEHHEAELIVDDFRRLHEEHGIAWKDMAVLYRVNALSRVLEERFRSANVPYVIARGTAFYDRKEIKDALAYLRFIANPSDEVSMRRIINTPTRGIGKTTLDRIEKHAILKRKRMVDVLREPEQVEGLSKRAIGAINKFNAMVDSWRVMNEHEGLLLDADSGLPELVERVVRESGLEAAFRKSGSDEDFERLENLEELVSAAADFQMPEEEITDEAGNPVQLPEPTVLDMLSAFLEQVALVSDADMVDPANGAVTLMTLHAAKGLEFDAVAMAGLEQGLLPHQRAQQEDAELEEERRLCFVGITRARKHLLITRAAVRTHRGLRERTIESQFLNELPGECVVHSDLAGIDDDYASGGGGPDPFGDDIGASGYGSWSPKASRVRGGRGGTTEEAFPVGCRVMHPKFGIGTVEAVTRRPAGSSAKVRFSSVGTKTLILEYAKLRRVE